MSSVPGTPTAPAAPVLQPDLTAGSGFRTLFYKEMLRFWKVGFQTVAAPVVTALLYLLIFAHVLEGRVTVYGSIPYTAFLIPGLMMMSMLQNAFANASSSLMQSRVTGNLVFMLLPPITHWEFFWAYVLAAVVRGLVVGTSIYIVALFFTGPHFAAPWWMLVFGLLGSAIMAVLGLIAGIWAEKFDQMAAFQNFLIMPATFLSGVFYSVHSLPPFWQAVSHWNPIFYTIDGFRHGFFGVSDVSPWLSLAVVGGTFIVVAAIALRLLASGYKLRY
ncbi:transport permease protein [Pigmentiphaga litoralis]|jgi:ABC-2 type transport system permease protein|uniref:ABC transporter permease n=1 Tax=Pigmentiphaga litoralis TaxID=516702 RepID=UPI0016770328|nr:ABC transporter permease [Pigmentiphaga litoralis]GGX20002.1 transport permease protein [Pigmentiphaga litoralis]